MLAEIISIGDELTSGQRLDTNSQWLAERLGELGVTVGYHTTVADDLGANVRVFREAVERVDLVVASGGLGPTADDLTRDALAQTAGVQLALDEPSLAHIRALFAHRKREMPERNVVQAMFPTGSRPIFNPQGTAPGIEMSIARQSDPNRQAHLFAMPGVPAEMKEMWKDHVGPAIAKLVGGNRAIRHRRIKCFGVGESDVELMLPDLIRRGRVPQVGITVSGATITLRITAEGATPEDCYRAMEPTIETIHQCLGTLIFGEEDDELEHAVVRLLGEHNATLATAEWGTGGLIAHRLSELPDAQGRYLGGVVVPGPQALSAMLGVSDRQVDANPLPSSAITEAMAVACRLQLGADLALAVSEFPPFDPQASQPGEVHYALATAESVIVRSVTFAGHPAILKTRSAKQALNLVRLRLLRAL